MSQQNAAALLSGLKQNRIESIENFLASPLSNQLYGLCRRLCLNDTEESEALFKLVIKHALKNLLLFPEQSEIWLFTAQHKEWINFARSKEGLQDRRIPLKFQWDDSTGKQSEDALILFTPAQRELFLYRFWLKLPATTIKTITGYSTDQIQNLFHEAISKVLLT